MVDDGIIVKILGLILVIFWFFVVTRISKDGVFYSLFQKIVSVWFDLLKWLIILSAITYADEMSPDPNLMIIKNISVLALFLYGSFSFLYWFNLTVDKIALLRMKKEDLEKKPTWILAVFGVSLIYIEWQIYIKILMWAFEYVPKLMTKLNE